MTNRRRPLVALAIAAAALLFGGAFAVQNRLTSARAGEWSEVRKDDLVLGVDVTGQLEATDAASIGPPQIEDMWDFKISMMAPEGAEVKKGQPVLGFDTSELDRSLEREQAEADSARKQIEKKQADLKLARRDQQLKLAEAESRYRKAELKLTAPPDVAQLNERKTIEFDFETATKEVNYRREALASLESTAAAELSLLEAKLQRATTRVARIQSSIQSMRIVAPRDGVVIYLMTRRNEKKKVGDSTWRGERLMQIPDLNALRAMGEVDENDAGRVFTGQVVTFRLDALPDDELGGKVTRVGSSVQRSPSRQTLKIMKVEMKLDRVDPAKMRPGMRFRGTLETDRARGVLLAPADAIEATPEGPMVMVQGLLSNRRQRVEIGRRNNEVVEILSGLSRGDRVMRREAEKEEKE